jgi:penicillin V acylase-like amidase (Ntn superfamily)
MQDIPVKKFLIAVILISLAANTAFTCTTFCFADKGKIVFGRNYDWDIGNGMLMINKRGMSKIAMSQDDEKSAKWISKYGSLTFNQYGREFPTGGMNEKGLVVELMMLNESIYPDPDRRPVVGCLEWIQYQLDNGASVADVIQNSQAIRISSRVKLHFLVSDRSGACITVEFLNGRFVPHYGENLPVAVLTNDTYDRSVAYLRTLDGFGGTAPTPSGIGSLERFGRAATLLKNYQSNSNKDIVSYSFDVLANVAQGDYTKWSIVYEPVNLRLHFRTSTNTQIKHVDFSKFDFSCATPVKVLNVNSTQLGDVSQRFIKYSTSINHNLVQQSYQSTPFLADTPQSEIDLVSEHPETFSCLAE